MTAMTDDPLARLERLLKEERRLYDEDRTSDEYEDALMALQDEAVNLAPALVEVAKAAREWLSTDEGDVSERLHRLVVALRALEVKP